MAERDQVGERGADPRGRDHGQGTGDAEVEQPESDGERGQRQRKLDNLDEVVGDQAPLPEQEVLEQGRDERRRDARQRDHKSRPSEPFEQCSVAAEDHEAETPSTSAATAITSAARIIRSGKFKPGSSVGTTNGG